MTTAKTITVAQFTAALDNAGIKTWEGETEIRIYDPKPSKSGTYAVIEDGFCDSAKGIDSYPDIKCGGVSGGFAAQIRTVRDSLLADLVAS